jgi:AcrR family transcriptional regulator
VGQAAAKSGAQRGGSRRAQRPRRPRQRSLETREKLVDAALQVFAARGFDGATTRVIAERAGVALAALPYHFETKEALWRAAAERIFGLLHAHFELRAGAAAARGATFEAQLRSWLSEFVRFAARHPELHRFMLQEGTGAGPRLAWLVEKHVRPCFDLLCGLLARAQRQGLAPRGRPEHLFYALIGAASMPYAVAPEFRRLTGDDPAAEPLVEAHVEFLFELFFSRAGRAA